MGEVESWEEENDIISKLLNEGGNDKNNKEGEAVSNVLSKSLHEEFMEIGECLHEPIGNVCDAEVHEPCSVLLRKRSSLQCIMNEFKSINQVVERKLSRQSLRSVSSTNQSDKHCRSLKIKPIIVRPPPGFSAQAALSRVEFPNAWTKCQNNSNNVNCGIKWRKSNVFLNEFKSLSAMMDEEISQYVSNMQMMQEQKQALHQHAKNKGKVNVLKTLLYEQRDKMKIVEKEYTRKMQETEETFKQQIERLQQTVNKHKHSKRCLQNEFNKALNGRESEIENLYAQVKDLQGELKKHKAGTDEIGMENEELHEMIEIKDKYIVSLRLQITNHQKTHTQNQWKLDQADDLLDMVERERDNIEKKAKEIIMQLRHQLKQERTNNERLLRNNGWMFIMNKKAEKSMSKKDAVNNEREFTIRDDDSLGIGAREKFSKIVHRSSSMRRLSVIDCSSYDKVPTVLKSLGWFTPTISRQC